MPIIVQFISDYVCPYCFINKIALQQACEGKEVQIEYLPYELTRENQTQVDIYHDPVRKSALQRTLSPIVKKLNLDMKVPPQVSPRPYTRLAHEGYLYAKDYDKCSLYNDKIYESYFSLELDIGKIDVLKHIADEIGLDINDFEKALNEGRYSSEFNEIKDSINQTFKISTLPTIKIGDTIISGGIYSQDFFESLFKKDKGKEIETDNSTKENEITGVGCNINGCSF